MKGLHLDIMAWFTFTMILMKLICLVSGFDYPQLDQPPTVFDTVRIYPGQDKHILREDSQGSKHSTIRAYNLGKHLVEGNSLYSNTFSSWKTMYHYTINPDELKTYVYPSWYTITTLGLWGAKGGSTIIYAERGTEAAGLVSHDPPPTPGLDVSFKSIFRMIRRFASKAAMKFIPHPGASIGVSLLIETLFADGKDDPWDQVKDRVKEMIDESKMVVIEAILSNDLEPLKAKVQRVQKTLGDGKKNTKRKKKSSARKFLSVLDIMVGFEKKFAFPVKNDAQADNNKKLNYRILPLYSRTINMKVSYYSWGIAYAEDLGLEDDEVEEIQEELDETIDNAEKHIADLYVQQVDTAYETCWPPKIYDCMMETRSNVAANGLAYISYWNTLKGGITYPNITNNVMLYSPFFGRASINLNKEAIINFGAPPLTPKLIKTEDGKEKRNKLVKVEFNMGKNIHDEPILVGAMMHFENNDKHLVGKDSSSKETLDLGNEFITKIQVNGSAVVDRITFTLSNGKEFAFGTPSMYNHVTFELDGYYISSFFMANDVANFGEQVANLAVSYQLFPDNVPFEETQENQENKAKGKKNPDDEGSESEEDD